MQFLDAHPGLRDSMSVSDKFAELKKRAGLFIDGEQIYVVRGDAQGDEDDLYLDALARGSNPHERDELARSLFLELDDHHRELILGRAGRKQSDAASASADINLSEEGETV